MASCACRSRSAIASMASSTCVAGPSFMCASGKGLLRSQRAQERVQRRELLGRTARGQVYGDLALAEAKLVLRDRLQLRDRGRIEVEPAADAERQALFVDHDARDAGLERQRAQP